MAFPTDFLSRVQLSAVALLQADSFFSTALAIPVVSEVEGDITSMIQQRGQRGLVVIVAVDNAPIERNGGGHMTISEGRLIVRVREVVPVNRSAAGYKETALTTAQAVANALQNARISDSNGTDYAGAFFTCLSIDRADPDPLPGEGAVVAWHVNFRFCGGIKATSRRSDPPSAGGM